MGKKMRLGLPGVGPLLAVLAAAASARAQEPPAIVALTLDTSGSIRSDLLAQTRELAIGVLQSLPPGSEVALFTFDDQSRLILERTKDAEAVKQALGQVDRAGRYTALYDALYDASQYLKKAPRARKAIVLITDGKDENSALQVEDGLRIAVDGHIPVYAVGVGRIEEAVLRRIAKLTAGEYLPMSEARGAAIAELVKQLGLPAEEPPRPAALPPAPAAAPAPRWTGLTLAVAVLGLVAVLGGVAIILLLRRGGGAEAAAEPGLGAAPPAGGTPGLTDAERADSTMVARNPGMGYVEKTVMLRVRPRLTITKGEGAGQVFRLGLDSAISIGRAPSNDIAVNDGAVSGEHCRVRPEGGLFVIHDLNSTNGTFVNDRRVTRQALAEGDLIRVGETLLQFGTESA